MEQIMGHTGDFQLENPEHVNIQRAMPHTVQFSIVVCIHFHERQLIK